MTLKRRSVLATLAVSPLVAHSLADQAGHAAVAGGKVWWRRIDSGPKTSLLLLRGGPGGGPNYLLPMQSLVDIAASIKQADAKRE